MTSPRPSRRRVVAGLLRVLLVAGVLPLMAPTCGTLSPGMKTFSRNSLIIPMDLCYQALKSDGISGQNGHPAYQAVGCPQGSGGDPGDVLKAYGLVYQLVRKNIPVYWVIAQDKGAPTDIDMSIQYNGGPPVLKYDWANNKISTTAPTSGSKIDYRGGPFVIDGSDYDAAIAILNANKGTFAPSGGVAVNVHVSSVAFQGYVAKTMAGGWDAGGVTNKPPKLALLNIGSNGIAGPAQNAEGVIQEYLKKAGLDTANAGGSASGQHGEIYDRLDLTDFLPASGSTDPKTSRLFTNGYQILWVPHWAAPGSCSNVGNCSGSQYSDAQVASTLTSIGAFVANGKDLFAECAGIGSFEGVTAVLGSPSSPIAGFGNGVSGTYSTHFLTQPTSFGFDVNAWAGSSGSPAATDTADLHGNYSSPLMQIGDYPFYPQSGAIDDYKPHSGGYQSGTIVFASAHSNPTYDVFSMRPAAGNYGTIVYLAGHSYSKQDVVGVFEVGGSRLVLNTLFNLGASCVETGVSCNTGLLGECAQGVMSCDSSGSPVCKPIKSPQPETCDGKDNNCNGLVDENLSQVCYGGPPESLDASGNPQGVCQAGVKSCVELSPGTWGMSDCIGEVRPSDHEICNGLDNDCDGRVGYERGSTAPLTQACYTGPSNTVDPITGVPRGICKPGQSTCAGGTWTACAPCDESLYPAPWRDTDPAHADALAKCEILPHAQVCVETDPDAGYDMSCTGAINCKCSSGTQDCYDGPTSSINPDGTLKGVCKKGHRDCNGTWSACLQQVLPSARDCSSSLDNDCNGTPDNQEPACQAAVTCPPATSDLRVCTATGAARYTSSDTIPTGKKVGDPKGVCADGVRDCDAKTGIIGECNGTIYPAPEICDGQDNNCDGQIDENPDTLCNAGFTCVHGVCVKASCGPENRCPEGYTCNATTSRCERTQCGDGTSATTCADGKVCQFGVCTDPCDGVVCAKGAVCSSGFCTGGGCYLQGCGEGSGQACIQGQCEPDPCSGVACPVGTFCRAGDCVQSCVYATCPADQICGPDGFCQTDACRNVTCDAGKICVAGTCQDDPCSGKGCGPRQICKTVDGQAVCQDDPCSVVSCPVGACSNGQCYPVTQRDSTQPTQIGGSSSSGGCGCGNGGGGGLGALLLGLLLPLLKRTRRPARSRSGAGRAALLGLAAVIAFSASACKSGNSTPGSTDYSSCAETCGENQCIDLNYDPAHCGHCGTTCDAGQICRDGACGPSSAVAPYIRTVSPDQANHGLLTPVSVTVAGDRFQDGASIRAVYGSGSRTYTATLVDSTHLRADINLQDIPATQLALRVVNPDHVISNGVTFDVVDVAPSITTVTPGSVTTGTATTLTVKGTGFAAGSVCHVKGGGLTDLALATEPTPDGTALLCTFDATATSVTAGGYTLWVVNGTASSNTLPFSVVSPTPSLASLSPSVAEAGSVIDIDIVGSGYDTSSRVYFQWGSGGTPTAVPTVFIDATHLLVMGYLLPGSAGTATVTVRNGSTPSTNSLNFTTVAALGSFQVSGLDVSPSQLYQGQNATLTFTGTNLPTGGTRRITVTSPTGGTVNNSGTIPTTSTTTVVGTVPLTSLSPEPAGTYSAFVTFDDGTTAIVSPSFQFQVLSNVAVLQSISPAGVKQGTNPAVIKFKAGNVIASPPPGVTISGTIAGKATTITPVASSVVLQSPPGNDPTLWQASFDMTGKNTGTYKFSVQNNGASASNQISFTIQPGLPAIGSISPTCAVQSSTPVTITINGSNFALPDAFGNAVTQVMYAVTNTTDAKAFQPIPATVTVNSATQLTVVFDTRNAVADMTYYISVWNPNDPLNGSAQHSGNVAFKVAASSCN